MEGILVPLGLFAAIVLIVYIFYANRNKERLALINKGLSAGILDRIPQVSLLTYKLGFFLIGVGLGSLAGNLVAMNTMLNEAVSYFSMIMLFGGASLIVFHLLEKRIVAGYKKPDYKNVKIVTLD
jgi:hypothetical protein